MQKSRKCGFNGLSKLLCQAIEKYGYNKPTSIQNKAIPVIKSGKNALIIAPTGSGKTEAVLFPLFDLILDKSVESVSRELPMLVYVTPLRALNRDIMIRMREISESIGLKVLVKHGDTSQSIRKEFLSNPPHWFITTPESFVLMLSNDRLRQLMVNLRYVVVDELHEIIDNKRGAALSLALARLSKIAKNNILYIGLSATIPSKDIPVFKKFFPVDEFVVIKDENRRLLDIEIRIPDIQYHLENEPRYNWLDWLVDSIYDILSKHTNAIIFTNTRDLAESLGNAFNKKYGNRYNIMVHHGSLSKKIRQDVEEKLKKGMLKAVIATSSLELGIDIGTIDVVIQVGSPRQVVRLIQRAGRSGHRLDAKSKAVILTEPTLDDVFESLTISFRALKGKLEKTKYPINPLDVFMHGMVGEAIANKNVDIKSFANMAKDILYYKELSMEEITKVVEHATSISVLKREGEYIVKESRRSRSYYFKTTMITDSRRIKVETATGEIIGYLDEEFVVSKLSEDDYFILAGKVWKVLGVENDKLIVEEADVTAVPPKWEGELIPVSSEVSAETCNSLYESLTKSRITANNSIRIIGKENLDKLLSDISREVQVFPNNSYNLIETSENGNVVVLYTCGGTKANDLLSILIAYTIYKLRGIRVASTSDPYRIIFYSGNTNISKAFLDTWSYLNTLDSKTLMQLTIESLKNSHLFDYVLFQVAKRMGIYSDETPINLVKKSLRYLKDTIVGDEALNEIISLKVDIEKAHALLKKRIKIQSKYSNKPGMSKITLLSRAFSKGLYVSYSGNNLAVPMILDIFEKKLLGKEITLFCLNCGDYFRRRISEINESPQCNKCGSRALVPLTLSETTEYIQVLKRYIKNPKTKISKNDLALIREARKRANLVLTYGKPAIVALSTYGIGPKNAAKALIKLKMGWRSFIEELYKKEVEYIRNRRFWDK